LLEKGANVGATSKNQLSNQPLHAAIAGRATATSLLLIEAGAPIHTAQHGGYTPLLEAAQIGNIKVVERLLELGVDIKAQTSDGKDALDLAREKGHTEVIELLLKNKNSPC
jgi:ankyrin repeat protein